MTDLNFQSEFKEDVWLWENFGDFFKVPNYYVDVGCAGTSYGSNTSFLRALGWNGLNIDGDERWAYEWPEGNFIHAVVSNLPGVPFKKADVACLSRIEEGSPWVFAVTLESILEANGVDQIGFLSVDVEGHELEVIQSLDLDRHQSQFIMSEYDTHGIGLDLRVWQYLTIIGYEVILQTPSNFVYRRCP